MAKNNKGITLITLTITMLVMAILSTVVIINFTGGQNLLKTSTNAVDAQKINEYKEIISQEIMSEVQENSLEGEETTLDDIKARLLEQNTIILSAEISTNEEETQNTQKDIIVTTDAKYVFQVYYDEMYGVYFVEYIGIGKKEDFPTITASYNAKDKKITANSKGKDAKLELIFRGEIIKPEGGESGSSITHTPATPGWYIIRATDSSGKLRYSWVKAVTYSSTLKMPSITVETGTLGNNGWYKDQLKLKITSNNEGGTILYYIQNNGAQLGGAATSPDNIESWTSGSNGSAEVEISTSGRVNVLACVKGSENEYSEINAFTAKLDKDKPTITITKSPSLDNGAEWYKTKVEITVNVSDTHSGASCYLYKEEGVNADYIKKNLTDKIIIAKEGETTLKIKAIDNAGNESEEQTEKIKRDSEGPNTAQIALKESSTGIGVEAIRK